jgi:hypothetical protein
MVATSNALAAKAMQSAMLAMALAFCAACDQKPPTTPTNPQVNLTGTWRGTITVDNTPAVMTWTLTDTAGAITGPVLIGLPTGSVLLNGVLAGTLTGTALAYTVSVPPGGVLSQPGCSGQIAGTTTLASSSTMTGAYTVSSSTCPTGLANGTFSLAKQ